MKAAAQALTLESALGPVHVETLGERVYADLREMLMAGRVEPGERLSLRPLARILGTSAMPVRDALRQLMVDGAVELLPNRHAAVPRLKLATFREITLIRLQLETLAAAQAAMAGAGQDVHALHGLAEAFTLHCKGPDPSAIEFLRLNKTFHFALYGLAGLPELMAMIERLWLRVGPLMRVCFQERRGSLGSMRAMSMHAAAVAAVERGDAIGARAAIQADIEGAADVVVKSGFLL